jgi:hypothetical protein
MAKSWAATEECAAREEFLLSIVLSIGPTLCGIAKDEQRQITLSVNDLTISCRTSYSPSVA